MSEEACDDYLEFVASVAGAHAPWVMKLHR